MRIHTDVGKPVHVLIADDSSDDRAEIKAALLRGSSTRFKFSEASLGEEVLTHIAGEDQPNCLLLDFHLPDMNAAELLGRMKRPGESMLPLPVVIVTGSERIDGGVQHVVRAGAMGFVGKDWLSPASLSRALEGAVERFALHAERDRLLTALTARERQLSVAQRAARLGLWDWNIVTGDAEWSAEAWALFSPGTSAGEVTFDRWLSVLHPEDRERAHDRVKRLLTSEVHFYQDEFRVLHPDGTIAWLEASGELARDPNGRPVRLIGCVRDITERKLREAELRASESRFRQLAETLPQIVYTTRADGNCDWVNRHWYRTTGFQEFGELQWLESIHPDDRAPTGERWSRHVASGEPFTTEYRVRSHDGTYRWHVSHAVALRDDLQRIAGWVGTSSDISDLREAAEVREHLIAAERSARNEAQSANHLKDEFLATLAHELRTPLSNVISWSSLLLKQNAHRDSSLAKGLTVINNNARVQLKLIADLLEVNRIVRGKVELEIKTVELVQFVEEAVMSHKPEATAKGIELRFDHHIPPGSLIRADTTRLHQVMGNLLTNALKFTPRGGAVHVGLRSRESAYEIAVRDSGEGIAPEFLPHIFDRFRQGDAQSARRREGLGLGLSIVQKLVVLHGGDVRAESAGPGRGAVFTVRLPAGSAAPAAIERSALAVATNCLQGIRAIVVDDEPLILDYLRTLLAEQGAETRACDKVIDALRAVRELTLVSSAPVVLITDIGMPDEGGYGLLRRVREELGIGADRMPVLAVTAYAREEDRMHALRAGFQGYVVKPVDAAELVGAVRAALDPAVA